MVHKKVLSWIIGRNNLKYLNKYLLLIVTIHVMNKMSVDWIKGNEVTFQSIGEILIITLIVLFVGFRIWIKIFEGTQAFWCWVLKIKV